MKHLPIIFQISPDLGYATPDGHEAFDLMESDSIDADGG